ncbi:MAG: SDR family NAD(P)-dependent oxidoreductase [Isosphaerales bacterium]
MKRSGNALVTGASSGLGRELVRQIVIDRGLTVMATARRIDRLETLAAELPPGRVEILAGDLADPDFRQRLWDRALAMPGGVDLLINNAGMGNYSEFVSQDPRAIHRILDLNLVALLDLTQKAARHMTARGTGQILQISSVLGFIGLRDSAVYVASKHAVNGLVKSLRYELSGTGVRVWAACPGRTQSEFRQVALGDLGDDSAGSPRGEPTAKIARAIVRGIDGRSTFLMPSWRAWLVVTLAHWLPAPFDWIMTRWAPSSYRDALGDSHRRDGRS